MRWFWVFLASASVVVLSLAGCGGEEDLVSAPDPSLQLSPPSIAGEDFEPNTRHIMITRDPDAFRAVAGTLAVFDFQSLPTPGSSCLPEEGDSGIAELPSTIYFPDWCRLSSPVCMTTHDPENTVLVLEEEGEIRPRQSGRSILIEYEDTLQGFVWIRTWIRQRIEFTAIAPPGETAFLGFCPKDLLYYEINLTGTATLHTIYIDERWADMEAAVVENMILIGRAFERFAELSGGVYPTAAADPTYEGDCLVDLLPGTVYPIDPYTGCTTVFNWNAAPAASSGSIAATTARIDEYTIRGRGRESSGLIDTMVTTPPLNDQLARNMRTIQKAFEAYADANGGIYPTAAADTLSDGRRVVDLLPGAHIPYNPYHLDDGHVFLSSPFSWNEEAETICGAITAWIAEPDRYEIRGRGDDPTGYLDVILTNE
ncbi:MAG: hypothetical protein JW958_13300 [Candidatus Eisenbacteria bacterium]|nr:hypothetical protein [Candidatus Eisenbacteria bacterium]